jgi:hypothetical protein
LSHWIIVTFFPNPSWVSPSIWPLWWLACSPCTQLNISEGQQSFQSHINTPILKYC